MFRVDISGLQIMKYFSHKHKLHLLVTLEYDRACFIFCHLMLYKIFLSFTLQTYFIYIWTDKQWIHCFTYPECTADAVTALCDEQVTAVRSFCADICLSVMVSNRSKVIFWRSAQQVTTYKWLNFDLDPVVIMCTERWSQIHCIFDE